MNIAFRITETFDNLRALCDLLQGNCSAVVIYEHDATRVHIHGLIKECKVSSDTLKNYVKRSLGVTTFPKSDWSFKTLHEGEPVGDGFITYMSKGVLQPRFVYGYTDEQIEHYKLKWIPKETKRRSLTQYKIKVENPKEAKIRQNEMMDMVKQRCKEKNISRPRDILEVIRDVVYRECKTVVGRYKIRDFYDYVTSDINEKAWLDNMEKLISYKEL